MNMVCRFKYLELKQNFVELCDYFQNLWIFLSFSEFNNHYRPTKIFKSFKTGHLKLFQRQNFFWKSSRWNLDAFLLNFAIFWKFLKYQLFTWFICFKQVREAKLVYQMVFRDNKWLLRSQYQLYCYSQLTFWISSFFEFFVSNLKIFDLPILDATETFSSLSGDH